MDGAAFGADPSVARFFYLKHATSYAAVSSMALILYDFVTTFSQEVELVWRSPLTLPKIVYLTNRYISIIIAYAYMITLFFADYNPTRCSILGQLHTWYGWLSTVLVQLVLQVWLYAIYNGYRQRLYWISVVYVLLAGLACGSLMPYISNVRYIAVKPVCVDVNARFQITSNMAADISRLSDQKVPGLFLAMILTWFAYSGLLLGLLASRVCVVFRARPSPHDGLAFVLFRDSTLYCITLLCLVLFNVLMVVLTPYALYQIGFGYAVALPSILSSHILLNLRAAEKHRAERTDVHGIAVEQWETMFHII